MSTLMSTDMHLKRASTRVHAPPGGQSSFNIGTWNEDGSKEAPPSPAKKKATSNASGSSIGASLNHDQEHTAVHENKKKAPGHSSASSSSMGSTLNQSASTPAKPRKVVEEVAKIEEIEIDMEEEKLDIKVGLAIASGAAYENFSLHIVKELAAVKVVDVVVTKVQDVNMLAFASQRLSSLGCQAVIAAGLVSDSVLAAAITGSILNASSNAAAPIIPAIISAPTMLESKALIPANAKSWAESVVDLLGMTSLESANIKAADPASPAVSAVVKPSMNNVNDLMNAFRASCKARGAYGITGLARKFKIADDDNSKTIDFKEFSKMISEHTFSWTTEQVKLLFDHFDEDKSKAIDFDEFLIAIRGELNERRQQLVLMAYNILDKDHNGVVDMDDISVTYDASKHPDVIAGKRPAADILREFLDTFDGSEKDGKVTPEEFCRYYGNVSSSIDDDDYFELMIRNAWHISGGEGWCANSSCRRVLVTHADGHQSVEEIKNDIGMKSDDKAAMLANLAAQGITDVVSIDLKGSADNTTPPTTAAPAKLVEAAPKTGRRTAGGGKTNLVLG